MRWLRVLVPLVALLVLGTPADAEANEAARRKLAQKYYEVGESLYRASSYEEALVEFKKAHRYYPMPGLLFNIARCYEVTGQLELAVNNYELFLAKNPDDDDRSLVEMRLANIKKKLAERRAQEKATQKAEARRLALEREAAERARIDAEQKKLQQNRAQEAEQKDAERKRRLREEATRRHKRKHTALAVAGWTAAGLGLATLGGGVVMGVLAGNKGKDYEAALGRGDTWTQLNAIDDKGKQYELLQIIGLAAGGALVAVGGGLLTWHYATRGDVETAAAPTALVVPAVGPGQLGLTGQVTF